MRLLDQNTLMKRTMKRRKGRLFPVVMLVAFAIAASLVSGGLSAVSLANAPQPKNLTVMDEVESVLREEYFDKNLGGIDWSEHRWKYESRALKAKTPEALAKILNEMLASLKDPDTYVMSPKEVREQERQKKNRVDIFGVGLLLGQMPSKEPVVRMVIPKSPADRAGAKKGDRISSVDGRTTKGMTLADVAARIRGAKGTKVTLGLLDPTGRERKAVATRAEVTFLFKVRTKVVGSNVGYISIPSFDDGIEAEVLAGLRKLARTRALIIDARDSYAGGKLATLQYVAGLFGKGPLGILVSRDGVADLTAQLATESSSILIPPPRPSDVYRKPIAILVDETTNLDILALGLKEMGRAVLVGRKTGSNKGSVQTPRELSDGSVLYLTTSRYTSPQGRILSYGATPDVVVPLTVDTLKAWYRGEDPDLQHALKALKQRYGI